MGPVVPDVPVTPVLPEKPVNPVYPVNPDQPVLSLIIAPVITPSTPLIFTGPIINVLEVSMYTFPIFAVSLIVIPPSMSKIELFLPLNNSGK